MSEKARGYWDLHIREDERHGRWMLNDVALPLAKSFTKDEEGTDENVSANDWICY